MNNLEMLMTTAFERVKNSSKKEGTYVYAGSGVKSAYRPIYIYYSYSSKTNEKGMDEFIVEFASAEWKLVLETTWSVKEGNDIYSLYINGEEADSLCPINVWALLPSVSITLIENCLLWWLTETTFPEEDEDEYI